MVQTICCTVNEVIIRRKFRKGLPILNVSIFYDWCIIKLTVQLPYSAQENSKKRLIRNGLETYDELVKSLPLHISTKVVQNVSLNCQPIEKTTQAAEKSSSIPCSVAYSETLDSTRKVTDTLLLIEILSTLQCNFWQGHTNVTGSSLSWDSSISYPSLYYHHFEIFKLSLNITLHVIVEYASGHLISLNSHPHRTI